MLKGFGSHFRHNVVAYLALFVALGGTAVAAKPLLTGADIEDGSLTGADVSDGSTLKGLDIDESDLGKVPSAQNSDSAANADLLDGKDASELAGKPTFTKQMPSVDNSPTSLLMSLDNGLELWAACNPDIELWIGTSEPGPTFFDVWGARHQKDTAWPETFRTRGSFSPVVLLIDPDMGFVHVTARPILSADSYGPWVRILVDAIRTEDGCDFMVATDYPK